MSRSRVTTAWTTTQGFFVDIDSRCLVRFLHGHVEKQKGRPV